MGAIHKKFLLFNLYIYIAENICHNKGNEANALCAANFSKDVAACLGQTEQINAADTTESSSETEGALNIQIITQCLKRDADIEHSFCLDKAENTLEYCKDRAQTAWAYCGDRAKTDEEIEQCEIEYKESYESCAEQWNEDKALCAEDFIKDAASCVEKSIAETATKVPQSSE